MRCDSARELLGVYLGEALGPELRDEIELHLADCETCAAELRVLREVEDVLRASAAEIFAGPKGTGIEALDDTGDIFNEKLWARIAELDGRIEHQVGPARAPRKTAVAVRSSRRARPAARRHGLFPRLARWAAVAAAAAAIVIVIRKRRAAPEEGSEPGKHPGPAPAPIIARVGLARGALEFAGPGGEEWFRGQEGTGLRAGDRLRTRDSRARIRFDSGSVIFVNKETVASFPVPVAAMCLSAGEIYVETAEVDLGFYVDTPQGRVVALGTRFGVATGAGRGTTVVVAGGKAAAATEAGRAELRTGEEVLLARRTSPPGPVREAGDLEGRLAWTRTLGKEGPIDSRPGRKLHVELRFDEGRGRAAANTGTLGAGGASAFLTVPMPEWSTNTPPGGGAGSLDFGAVAGPYAADLHGQAAALGGLRSFTITGWLNSRSSAQGSGGNRIVSWSRVWSRDGPLGDGVDLVFRGDGSLQVGINEWPDGSVGRSSAGKITVDPRAARRNWRFFAVTYDGVLPSGQLRFLFGGPQTRTSLDRVVDYERGPLGARVASAVTIGHFCPEERSKPGKGNEDRMFRGLVDEIKIYGSAKDGTGALALEEIEAVRLGGSAEHGR